MPTTPTAPPNQTRQTMLLVWAVSASVAALVFASLVIILRLQPRQPSPSAVRAVSASQFIELEESGIPGRYKWTEKGRESFITLNTDHTFIASDGRTYPSYRWEILRDGFLIVWQRDETFFNHIERPGVYTGMKPDGTVFRMEKVE